MIVVCNVQEDKLKTAILDYLKRFHSEDKDTYSMVALNFSMYREIAHMLDESGHRSLHALKDRPLGHNLYLFTQLHNSFLA